MWRASLFPFGTSWLHLDQCKIHPHSFLCLNQLWSTQLHKFLQAASVVRMCAPGWLQATCPYPRDPSDEETRFRNHIFRWRNNVEGSADSAKGHSCALLLHWSRWDLFQPAAAAWGARSFVFWQNMKTPSLFKRRATNERLMAKGSPSCCCGLCRRCPARSGSQGQEGRLWGCSSGRSSVKEA